MSEQPKLPELQPYQKRLLEQMFLLYARGDRLVINRPRDNGKSLVRAYVKRFRELFK